MKLKKIVAAVCAAAMTVSAVAITPLLASAETEALKTWQKEESGGADSDTYAVSLSYGEAIDCKSVDVYLNDITTDYIKMVITKDAGYNVDSEWVSDYVNEYFEVPISGDTATLSIVLGETLNVNGVANALAFTEEDTGKSDLLFAPNWLNAGSFSLSKIVIKNADGIAFKTIVGDEIVIDEPEEPAPEEPSDSIVLWEGSKDLGTDWGSNVRTSVAADKVKAGDTIKITYEAGTAAEYQQIKLMQGADGWPVLTSVKVSEWGTVDLDAASTEFTFVINADDAAAIIANNIIISGYNVTIKSIEVIPAASEPETPSDPVTPTAPSANPLAGNCTVMPAVGGAINLTASDNAAAIAKLKDGASYEYELSDMNPVIKRRVFQSIMGRDITLKVTYKGMTWEFNGKEITEPHTVNFKTLYEKAMAE